MGGRVGPDGTVRDPGGFVIGSGANDRFFPDATFDGTNYYVVWQDRRQGMSVNQWSIYGARVTTAGVVLDPTGRAVVNNDAKYEGIPQVCWGDSTYLVTYKDDGFAMRGAARVRPDGTVLDPDGFDVAAGVYGQGWNCHIRLGMAFDGTNYLTAWPDYRNGSYDIYGVRITPDRQILDPGGFTIARIDPERGLIDTNSIPAVITAEMEGGPAVAGGPSGSTAVLFQRYAPAPWMCTRAWAAVYTEQSGLAECHRLTANRPRPTASHARGVINLMPGGSDRMADFTLLDATGRRVMALRPGDNDVSGLTAGACFVQTTAGNRRSTVARVVVAR